MTPTILRTPFGELKAQFKVPVPNQNPVHMSFALRNHMADHSAIAIVDAKKFIELWRNDPLGFEADKAFGTEKTWRADYKFQDAHRGFAHGEQNPVPLAFISFNTAQRQVIEYKYKLFGKRITSESLAYVSFTNGITRTIWLLANQSPTFPIECELPGAVELQRLAGALDCSLYRVDELIRQYKSNF